MTEGRDAARPSGSKRIEVIACRQPGRRHLTRSGRRWARDRVACQVPDLARLA